METLFRFFLKLFTLPGKINLNLAFHVALVLGGIAVLYLLTLRKGEKDKLEDYLQRVRNRMHNLREIALERHITIINVTATILSSFADKLFGEELISTQAIGVSVSLALFLLNLRMFVSNGKGSWNWERLTNTCIFLTLALFPLFIDALRSKPHYRHRAQPRKIGWLYWWFFFLVLFVAQEYVSPFTCTTCIPEAYQYFFFAAWTMVTAIAVVGAVLFTAFVVVTRFSLKRLSTPHSAIRSVGFLLIGCIPIPVFFILLKMVVFLLNHTTFTPNNPADPNPGLHMSAKEWIAIGSLAVFGLSFFVNVAFLCLPVLFFSMAALLFVHRLLWPMLERPLETLDAVGITKHRWVIFLLGIGLIAFGIGGLEALVKVFKFLGHSTT